MFSLSLSGLIAAYVLVALLLLSLLIYSRWAWWIKGAAVIVTSAFYLITYFSFPPLLGWPTNAPPPQRFHLVAIHIQEPSKIIGSEGQIYIWAVDAEGHPAKSEPRAHRLPYTNLLHERAVAAQVKLRKGLPQLGEMEEGETALHTEVEDQRRAGQKSINIQFYDLPDPLFPEK